MPGTSPGMTERDGATSQPLRLLHPGHNSPTCPRLLPRPHIRPIRALRGRVRIRPGSRGAERRLLSRPVRTGLGIGRLPAKLACRHYDRPWQAHLKGGRPAPRRQRQGAVKDGKPRKGPVCFPFGARAREAQNRRGGRLVGAPSDYRTRRLPGARQPLALPERQEARVRLAAPDRAATERNRHHPEREPLAGTKECA
jgi:hypothetical protein